MKNDIHAELYAYLAQENDGVIEKLNAKCVCT